MYEWGEGKTEREAIGDLVSSLGEYKLSLMDYKDELGDCPARDLELLERHGHLALDYRRFQSALTTKASADENRKRNHIYFYAVIKGKRYRITKISHGAKGQISKSRLGDFAQQMRLSGRQHATIRRLHPQP